MNAIQKVVHYGAVNFGGLKVEAVVLDNGARGFVQRQFAELLGYNPKNPGNRFRDFLANFAPNALAGQDNFGVTKVLMPHGGNAGFIPADAVMEMVDGVVDAALDGSLHHKQRGALAACRRIQRAMAKVGLIALIDEATGYQNHRAPDALQKLLGKLLRNQPADWERRFHPSFYHSLMRLMGKPYKRHTALPNIIGNITARWVYGVVFPPEIMAAMRERRREKSTSDKLHQWLSDGGMKLLERQIDTVTTLAATSSNLKDFEARCTQRFEVLGQVGMIFPMQERHA